MAEVAAVFFICELVELNRLSSQIVARLKTTPESCPNCGADLPRNARACPECGSDENTGWSEEARAGGLGLPEEDFDYNEFVKNEFGEERQIKPKGLHWFWWTVGLLLLVGVVYWLFARMF